MPTDYDDVSDEPVLPHEDSLRRWRLARVIGYTLLVGIAFVAVNVAVVGVVIAVRFGDDRVAMEQWIATAESDGLLTSLSMIASATVCTLLIIYLVGRREPDIWQFLRIKRTNAARIVVWCLAMIAFGVGVDLLTIATGRSAVPDSMVAEYLTAWHPAIFFVALVIAAPFFEEVFCRGFMLGGLEASGVSPISAAIVTSALWAALHQQYDLYYIVVIFVMGLLLSTARYLSGSLWPCVGMHGLNNAIAFVQTALVAESVGR